jgi:hypothetical protein
MNWADLMLRGGGAIRGSLPYIAGIGCAAALSSATVHSCNRNRAAQAELTRLREQVALAEHGVQPSIPVSDKEIQAALNEEKKTSAVLRIALVDAERRIRAATGKAPKVIEVVKWITIPGHAGGTPPPGRPDCLVSKGDTLEIQGVSAKYETKGKNHVIVGTAACRRLLPLPATTLYEGPFALDATRSLERRDPAQDPMRRWGFGAVGSLDTAGKWAVGPQVGYHFSRLNFSLGITFPDQRAIGAATVCW